MLMILTPTDYWELGYRSWYSNSLGLDGPGFKFEWGQLIFSSPKLSRLTLGPTHSPLQWAPGFYPMGVKLTTHLYLVLRLRMNTAVSLLPLYTYAFTTWTHT